VFRFKSNFFSVNINLSARCTVFFCFLLALISPIRILIVYRARHFSHADERRKKGKKEEKKSQATIGYFFHEK